MCFFSWKKSDLYDRRTGSCVVLPCGRCIGCRLDSLAIWSVRASSEMIKYRNSFVTFTYDTLHLPYNVGSLFPTLRKDDFHKFLNSFRHNIRNNYTDCMPYLCTPDYKYYCVGEYGDSFQRPHYHALFFGLDFHDFSKVFSKYWLNGSVESDSVSKSSIRYVFDYMTKSVKGSFAENLYDFNGRERPFNFCSNKFGYDYFYSRRDEINKTGFVTVCGRAVPVPQYYKKLFTKIDFNSVSSRADYLHSYLSNFLSEVRFVYGRDFDSLNDYQSFISQSKYDSLTSKMLRKGRPIDSVHRLEVSYQTHLLADVFNFL